MTQTEKQFKILELVADYITTKHAEKKWTAGKDWVQYAGPFYDSTEYVEAVKSLLGEWLVLGNAAIEFERRFPKLMNRKYGVVTNSGSSANLLMVAALKSKRLWNLKDGNIVTPVAGFPTTVNPIIQLGFKPLFLDIELETLNLDVNALEAATDDFSAVHGVSPAALIFSHVLGNPPNMKRVMEIAKRSNMVVLEDCCDALGSTYDGIPLGSFGDLSSYSFYPAHHLSLAEGGFVVCNTFEQETVVRSLREWGRSCYCVGKAANLSIKGTCGCRFKNWIPAFPDEIFDHKYVYEEIGYNLKPIEMQCAMGLAQLDKLPAIIDLRKQNYQRLFEIFKPYEEFFILPKAREHADVSWFAFPLTIKDGAPFKRSEFCRFLEDRKIQTRNYFGGNLLLQPAYADLAKEWGTYDDVKKAFPNATKVTVDTFFLGTSPVIQKEQTTYIQEVVNEFFKKK
jgi:CDP-6-deoxy-D-xylo-4-hexulose-3-dehydrase